MVSYWRKYVHKVLVNRLGGLSLPRKRVVRLTDRPDMTLDVYRGRKTTIQQQQPVQMNGSIGEWFRTTVAVRQGCLLSPTLFNIFLERIMYDAQEEHVGKVSVGGRNITNLRFADDIDALAEEEQELEAQDESLHKTFTRYKMKISAEKTKLMTDSANGIQSERDKGKRAFNPAGIWCQNDVVSTSMRRNHVASTLIRRHFRTKCPLGSTMEQLFEMMAPNQRFSQGLHKPLRLIQS